MENLKEGYKKTEIGIIPEDWEVKKLENYLTESRVKGDTGAKAKKLTVKLWGKGVCEKVEIRKGSENTQYYIRKKGQLIYSKLDFLNCAFGIIPDHLDGYQSTLDLPCFDINGINSQYLLYVLTQKSFYKRWGSLANGGRKAKRINQSDFLNFKIQVPPLPEQKKIAQILSTWDNAIEKLELLINKKTEYKKGLMQKLLSGELRFPEFKEEWEEVKLGDVLKERKEYASKNEKYEHLSLTTEGIFPKPERYNRDFLVKKDDKKYKITRLNDICYNPANLKFGVICKNEYGEGIFSPIYITFEVKQNFDSNYIKYIVKSYNFIQKALKYQEGTVYERMAVKPRDLLKIKILLPPLQEQQKIAEILSLHDKEIELLKKKLNLLKEQKKGLMQQLLTGKIRVKT
jgi:type I restriction enzyme S subunit